MIFAIGFLTILLTAGVTYMATAREALEANMLSMNVIKAYYHAESGVEHAIAEILNNDDVDGDGLGTLPPTDLDGDLNPDYIVAYDDVTHVISVTGNGGNVAPLLAGRQLEVEILTSPFIGAMQVNGNIQVNAPAGGNISGDVYATGTINANMNLFSPDNQYPGYAGMPVPAPDWIAWQAAANYNHADCTTFDPANSGIHYVTGNCIIDGGSTVLTFNGTLIAQGDVTIRYINQPNANTPVIRAAGNNPSIISGGHLYVHNILYPRFEGFIYADTLLFQTFAWTATFDGGIVTNGLAEFTNISNLNLIYNQSLAPDNFTSGGGGGISIVSWKGHSSGS